MDLKPLARDERADLAEFLATLSPEQWEAPTLCAGWRVRDVVAHMLNYDEQALPRPICSPIKQSGSRSQSDCGERAQGWRCH